MNIEEILKKSNLPIEDKEIKFNEPMNKHSTFKIGGPAECFIKINKEEQLKEILKIAKQNKIPLTIIGNGSNILVSDDGITISRGNSRSNLTVYDTRTENGCSSQHQLSVSVYTAVHMVS